MCVLDAHVQLLVMSNSLQPSWIVAYQAPLSTVFSRQDYWSGLSFPPPGNLPNPGIKPGSPTLQADSLPSEPPEKPCATLLSHRFPHASTDLVQSLPPLFFLFTHLPQIYHPRTSAHTVFSSETWIEHYNWQRPLCLPPSYCRWGNWSFEKGSDFSKTTQWISNRRIQLAESHC